MNDLDNDESKMTDYVVFRNVYHTYIIFLYVRQITHIVLSKECFILRISNSELFNQGFALFQ